MKKYQQETAVGLFVIVCMLFVGYLSINLGNLEIFGKDYYTLKARFSSVSGLREGADVEVAGVKVGNVLTITLDQTKGVAVVTLRVQEGVELSRDTIASIKTSGLIGDKYVNLAMGGEMEMLHDGDTIVETESALDIEELISKYAFGEV